MYCCFFFVLFVFVFFLYVLTRKNPFHSSEVNKAKFKWTALSLVYHTNSHICNGDFLVAELGVS